jgi:hypothetical protein
MEKQILIREELLATRIFILRGKKIMFDFDLASLYQIETRALKQQVRRNMERFPEDFMFVLSDPEMNRMVSQNVIPSKSYFGGAMPMAFTELGVAMLSSILKSKQAILVNISIMRAFVNLRRLIDSNRELAGRVDLLEEKYDRTFSQVFEAIRELIGIKNEPMEKIGFKIPDPGK